MNLTRREFIIKSGKSGACLCLAGMLGCKVKRADISGETEFEIIPVEYSPNTIYFSDQRPLVSIVKINRKWSDEKGSDYAVFKAIDLIGGLSTVTKGKNSILLKPNLVGTAPSDTTKPHVIGALAKLMKKAGKDVSIGEACAAATGNMDMMVHGYVCRTKNYKTLVAIQDEVFAILGYNDLSERINIPLVNLHVGRMAKMNIPDNFVFNKIYIHEDLSK